MPDLDPATVAELDQLCDHAHRVIEGNRHLPVRHAGPAIFDALAAIRNRLQAAGVEDEVAVRAVDRWYITLRPVGECLEVEINPPYPITRAVPGVARTNPPGGGL